MITLTLKGKPCSLKNNMQLFNFRGRPRAVYGKQQREWLKDAIAQIKEQWSGDQITDPIAVAYKVAVGPRQRIDLDNAILGPADAMEKAGVIKNDRQIVRIAACLIQDERHDPRIEIRITEPGQ